MARRPVVRNFAARSPLMHKGGAHQRSTTSDRRELEFALEDELLEWYQELEIEKQVESPDADTSGNRDD